MLCRTNANRACACCGSTTKGCSSTEDGLHFCRGSVDSAIWQCVKISDNGFRCYRRKDESQKGHFAEARKPESVTDKVSPVPDWSVQFQRFQLNFQPAHAQKLADELQLPLAAMSSLEIGWLNSEWIFAEYDGAGKIIGLLRRRPISNGKSKKLAMKGSRRGLTIPKTWESDSMTPIFLVEGASDVISAEYLTLTAIGRPNNLAGAEFLQTLLSNIPQSRRVVVIGENDRKSDQQWPGREGAIRLSQVLATRLNRPIEWAMTPDGEKDVRSWVIRHLGHQVLPGDLGKEFTRKLECKLSHPEGLRLDTTTPHLTESREMAIESMKLVTIPLSTVHAKPVKWLVPKTIPKGKLTMLAGVGGSGKSSLSRHLIACLTTARPFLDLPYSPKEPCSVLLASIEDSAEDTILPHLAAEGADLQRVHMIKGTQAPNGSLLAFNLQDIQLITRNLKENPEIRLLVIDPILSFVGRAKLNENSTSEIRSILDPLIEVASETGVSIILIAHLNKSSNTPAINRILGSTAFRDACRCVYVIGEHPNDPKCRVMALTKDNVPGIEKQSISFERQELLQADIENILQNQVFAQLSDEDREELSDQLFRIKSLGRCDVSADEALGTNLGIACEKSDATKVIKCTDFIRTFLQQYQFPSTELEQACLKEGYSKSTQDRACRNLKGDKAGDLFRNRDGKTGIWWVGLYPLPEHPRRPEPFV